MRSVYFDCKVSDINTNKLALERRVDDGSEATAAATVTVAPKHLITKNQIE